jgi:hypothetical protein
MRLFDAALFVLAEPLAVASKCKALSKPDAVARYSFLLTVTHWQAGPVEICCLGLSIFESSFVVEVNGKDLARSSRKET